MNRLAKIARTAYVRLRAIAFRWVAHPRVRRVVMPLVGALERLRTRNLSTKERWDRSIGWEVSYWDDWLRSAEATDLLDMDRPLAGPPRLAACVEAVNTDHVRILVVGAGPLTVVGRTFPGKMIEVTATDALANDYDEILARTKLCHQCAPSSPTASP